MNFVRAPVNFNNGTTNNNLRRYFLEHVKKEEGLVTKQMRNQSRKNANRYVQFVRKLHSSGVPLTYAKKMTTLKNANVYMKSVGRLHSSGMPLTYAKRIASINNYLKNKNLRRTRLGYRNLKIFRRRVNPEMTNKNIYNAFINTIHRPANRTSRGGSVYRRHQKRWIKRY